MIRFWEDKFNYQLARMVYRQLFVISTYTAPPDDTPDITQLVIFQCG